jgi:hypothetical protein
MAKKHWTGDGDYVLPARRVEPYRLWFEYLKLAKTDPEVKIDKRIYRSWGDVENLTFTNWWSDHWRDLFAVDSGVRLMENDETLGRSNSAIALRIPLSMDETSAIKEVRDLIREHGIGSRDAPRVQGKFALSEGSKQGFEKRMNTARCMLRLYGYWLKHEKAGKRKRVEKSALDYLKWVEDWEAKIREKGSSYRGGWRPYLAPCFTVYGEHLRELVAPNPVGKIKKKPTQLDSGWINEDGDGLNVEEARRRVMRYITKARKIAENIGQGEFPGKY